MAEVKTVERPAENTEVLERARNFWERNSKTIIFAGLGLLLLIGGYLAYRGLVQGPKETKGAEAMYKAENYYRTDSLNLALNGDGANPGFLKIISQYGGTKAGNLAHFYAGSVYLQQGDAAKAQKHLADFETESKQIQARAYKLLGDAYAEQGKNGDAFNNYKKAAHHFETDETASSEYLFMAAYFADRVMKDQKQAVTLFQELKDKYSKTEKGFEAEKYLAQLGALK
ncbi:MAG: tetratricopeptide repeat protein [Chitinophagaceae bacterium]